MTYVKQSWENYPSTATPINATRLAYMEDGIFNASRFFNVKNYGAVGDGTTNDIAAITAALDAAEAAGGGTVYFPAGTYRVTSSVAGYRSRITLQGEGGRYATKIKSAGNFAPIEGSWEYCVIRDITLDANSLGGEGIKVYLNQTTLDHVTVINWDIAGMSLNDGAYVAEDTSDLGYLNRIQFCHVDSPTVGAGYGIYTTYRLTDSWISYCNIGSTLANIRTESGPMRIVGCHLNGSPEYNILMEGPNRVAIKDNLLEGALKSAIQYVMPGFETGHTQHQIAIVGNELSNGGYSPSRADGVPGTYPAVNIVGKSATDRTLGLLFTGNLVAVNNGPAGWSAAVYCKWADELTITGNSWSTGYDDTDPVTLEGCGSNVSVVGNGGRDGVTVI